VDAALALAAAEPDEATRLQMYRDIEKQILADLPAIPIYRDSSAYVLVKPYVKDFVLTPVSAVNLWREIYVVAH
jgi:ABC-type transport system substrate-binding protein